MSFRYQRKEKPTLDFFAKCLLTVLLTLCGWPMWAFYGLWCWLEPHEFWQKFAMIAGGVLILGGFQVMFAVLWFAGIVKIWLD